MEACNGLATDLVSLPRCNVFPQIAEFVGLKGGFCMAELTPFAILISAIIALFVGWLGWLGNRKLARERAAVRLIMEREAAVRDDFRSLWMMIQKNSHDPEFFFNLGRHFPVGTDGQGWEEDKDVSALPTEQQQWFIVSSCLHYYEAIAVAIDRGAIDKETVAGFLKEKFKFYMTVLYPFIQYSRTQTGFGSEDTWVMAQKLAESWGAEFPTSE